MAIYRPSSSYQLNAHFLYFITIYICYIIYIIVTLHYIIRMSPLSTGIPYGRLQRVTIPEAVIIQFVLLKINKVLLETC